MEIDDSPQVQMCKVILIFETKQGEKQKTHIAGIQPQLGDTASQVTAGKEAVDSESSVVPAFVAV